ncbi:hypothetical protein ABH922_004376 [Rhodococcus sp. 27YEA15]
MTRGLVALSSWWKTAHMIHVEKTGGEPIVPVREPRRMRW